MAGRLLLCRKLRGMLLLLCVFDGSLCGSIYCEEIPVDLLFLETVQFHQTV